MGLQVVRLGLLLFIAVQLSLGQDGQDETFESAFQLESLSPENDPGAEGRSRPPLELADLNGGELPAIPGEPEADETRGTNGDREDAAAPETPVENDEKEKEVSPEDLEPEITVSRGSFSGNDGLKSGKYISYGEQLISYHWA